MSFNIAKGFSDWAKQKAEEAMIFALKYTVSVYMPYAYDGYNAAIGKDFITGQELSTTQRVLSGISAGLYFVPDVEELAMFSRSGKIAIKEAYFEGTLYRSAQQEIILYRFIKEILMLLIDILLRELEGYISVQAKKL